VLVAASLTVADPALLIFALDPELVALLVLSSFALFRASPAVTVARGFVASVACAARRGVRLSGAGTPSGSNRRADGDSRHPVCEDA
jgi:hypothetical protein